VANVSRIFTAFHPFDGEVERLTHRRRCPLGGKQEPQFLADFSRFLDGTLASASAGRRAFRNGIDQGAADRAVGHLIRRQIELEKAHRTLDVHAHRPRIHMSRRNQDTAHRRSVAGMGVRVEHEIGDPGGTAGIEGLLETTLIERGANRVGANHCDWLALVPWSRDESGRVTGHLNLSWIFCDHYVVTFYLRFSRRASFLPLALRLA